MTPEPGRLSQPPAPELIDSAYRWEVGLAPHLWQGMGLSDLAHHIMLLEAGILPPDPGARLLRLLLDLNATPHEAAGLSPEHGDVYTNRERWLGARDAAAAGWLSAGRARREATTVAYHLAVRLIVAQDETIADVHSECRYRRADRDIQDVGFFVVVPIQIGRLFENV